MKSIKQELNHKWFPRHVGTWKGVNCRTVRMCVFLDIFKKKHVYKRYVNMWIHRKETGRIITLRTMDRSGDHVGVRGKRSWSPGYMRVLGQSNSQRQTVITRAAGRSKWGVNVSWAQRFCLGRWKSSRDRRWWWSPNNENVLNATGCVLKKWLK